MRTTLYGRVGTALAVTAVLGAVTGVGLLAQDRPAAKVKVYCELQEKPGGFVNPALKDSLKDVEQAIGKKKNWLQLVEARELADVIVTIEDRRVEGSGRFEHSSTATSDSNGTSARARGTSKEVMLYVVRGTLTAGEYRQDIEGSCPDTYAFGGLWRTAASAVAGEVEKFAKGNYDRIMAQRAKLGR